jgi:predicted ATPase
LHLDLRPLSVLTGVNSGGKSSVVQALLLLHSPRLPGNGVALNGPFGLALGEASDVLHSEALSFEIEIGVTASGTSGSLRLDVPSARSPMLVVSSDDLPIEARVREAERGFSYLSTERLGPRDLQEVATDFEANLSVGSRGEHTAHVISQLERLQVDENRRHPDTEDVITLGAQIEKWMSSIVGPLQIEARWLPGTNAATLRFKSPALITDWLRPSNVGFSVSYSLPIVVAALTSPPGGLLVVENPESHLHPAGQSAMGRFLARIAAAGTQVVLETQSDHVLDGLRRAVGAEQSLPSADMIVHFFGADGVPKALTVDSTGALSEWPTGFFDQTEQDLSALARAKNRAQS